MENTLLNLVPASYLPEVHLSQYDVGRELKFTLKDGSSDYTVPSGAVVTVKATKPSGLGFVVNATAEGSVVTLSNTETMTNENGRFPAELSITQGSTVIGTSNFIFNIERSPHPEGTIDGDAESLLPELTLLVERIEAAADSVDEDTQIVTDAKAEVLQAKADTLQAKADTLTARDDALQAKADAITAKESAEESAQAAEEASERAEELIGSVSTKADAIVKTASGEIASFSDGGDELPMKSLKVNIVPKQSGSGDPSPTNIRPISGVDTVGVTRTGKNLFHNVSTSTTQNGTTFTKNADGSITVSGTPSAKATILINDGYVSNNPAIFSYGIPMPSGTRIYAKSVYNGATTYPTISSNSAPYVTLSGRGEDLQNIALEISTSFNGTPFTIYPMIELGSTPTAYEPYEGESKSISLGQTVYGGVLDVVSGKLTIDRAKTVLGASPTTGNPDAYGTGVRTSLPCPTNDINRGKWSVQSGALPIFDRYGGDISKGYSANNYTLFFNEVLTKAEIDSMLANAEMVYKLATPTEITLTPTEVKTLLGDNNIWSNSGSVEVEYRADSTLVYNELLALIASL